MRLLRLLRDQRSAWLLALVLLGLVGCAKHPEIPELTVRHAPSFSASGPVQVPDRWWMAFDDSALDHEIERCLTSSFTLATAWQRLRAAEALTNRVASDLWPDVNGFGEAVRIFRNEVDDESEFTLSLDTAYQVDLWGEIRSRVDAERLRTSATLADYHATALTLSADVAATWFSLIEARAQLALLNQQLETNLKGLSLLKARFGLGQSRSPDVDRQEQLVESTREQLVVVEARIEVLEHQLAVLQGRPPQHAFYDTGKTLPSLPPLPDTGLPADLVNRRPDVLRDYLLLKAADRDLASAVSAQYPRIDLTASVTTVAEKPENLFEQWIITLAGQFIAPLIDGGQRRAEVDRNAAITRQRLNEYGASVLQAFREVEDALAREAYQLKRIEYINAQLALARRSSESLTAQYLLTEEADFLDVLNATTEQQRLQRATLSARLELLLNRISLYLALAGDFESYPPEYGGGCPPEFVGDD